mmetsp:Transcript_48952/g.95680  ORF Transcript_48952/g.95680 Transcript_48952/m.95680 type:complete len:610 (+) Transcript_48952:47-1876(+)
MNTVTWPFPERLRAQKVHPFRAPPLTSSLLLVLVGVVQEPVAAVDVVGPDEGVVGLSLLFARQKGEEIARERLAVLPGLGIGRVPPRVIAHVLRDVVLSPEREADLRGQGQLRVQKPAGGPRVLPEVGQELVRVPHGHVRAPELRPVHDPGRDHPAGQEAEELRDRLVPVLAPVAPAARPADAVAEAHLHDSAVLAVVPLEEEQGVVGVEVLEALLVLRPVALRAQRVPVVVHVHVGALRHGPGRLGGVLPCPLDGARPVENARNGPRLLVPEHTPWTRRPEPCWTPPGLAERDPHLRLVVGNHRGPVPPRARLPHPHDLPPRRDPHPRRHGHPPHRHRPYLQQRERRPPVQHPAEDPAPVRGPHQTRQKIRPPHGHGRRAPHLRRAVRGQTPRQNLLGAAGPRGDTRVREDLGVPQQARRRAVARGAEEGRGGLGRDRVAVHGDARGGAGGAVPLRFVLVVREGGGVPADAGQDRDFPRGEEGGLVAVVAGVFGLRVLLEQRQRQTQGVHVRHAPVVELHPAVVGKFNGTVSTTGRGGGERTVAVDRDIDRIVDASEGRDGRLVVFFREDHGLERVIFTVGVGRHFKGARRRDRSDRGETGPSAQIAL